MILSPDEVAAARAIGCAFFPATELQVQRLTMQQRIFTVEGKRYLVSRDGSYFETVGTLRALLAKYAPPPSLPEPASPPAPVPAPAETAPPAAALPDPPPPKAQPPVPAPAETAPQSATLPEPPPPQAQPPVPAPVETAPLAAEQPELPPPKATPPEPAPAAEAAPRRRRPRKAAPPVLAPEPAPPLAPPTPEAVAARSDRLTRLARRMAGGELPRWQVAGAARRGRVKLF